MMKDGLSSSRVPVIGQGTGPGCLLPFPFPAFVLLSPSGNGTCAWLLSFLFVSLALQSDHVVLHGPNLEASVLYQRVKYVHVGEGRIDINNKLTLEKFWVTSISFIQCLIYAASQNMSSRKATKT